MINENAKRNTRIPAVFSLLLFTSINLCAFSAKTLDWANSIGEGMQEAKRTNKPIMIDFYIDHWSACKLLDAETFTDKKVIGLSKKFVVLKVNPGDRDHPKNAEMVSKHGIYIYPTIAFLSSEGDFISSNTGYIPPDQFSELMKKTLKEENKLENLRAEIQKNPENLKANISLAMIYIKRGNLTKGQALINTISVLDPSNQSKFFTKVYAEMALAPINPSNIEEGEALLDKASALDLKDDSAYLPKLHFNFGIFYYDQSRQNNKDYPQKAEKHFKIVIDKYPQSEFHEPAQLYLAVTYFLQGKKPMAISLLEKLSSQAQDSDIQREVNRILGILKNQVK